MGAAFSLPMKLTPKDLPFVLEKRNELLYQITVTAKYKIQHKDQ
jgi:hypothetical protein